MIDLAGGWQGGPASLDRGDAARGEGTAFGALSRGRDGAGDGRQADARRIGSRDRVDQRPGVAMACRAKKMVNRPGFDDAASVHHGGPVANLRDNAEIMGDEQAGHAGLAAQLVDQGKDLGLNCDIERGRGLVRDQKARLAGQRHGDHHALPLAAGKLVRVPVDLASAIGDSDPLDQLCRPVERGATRQGAMQHQHFRDLLANRENRVERGHRLLKNHGDLVAPNGAHRLGGKPGEIAPLVEDAPRADRNRRIGQQPQDREGRDAFATAGFADKAQHLSHADLEGDVLRERRISDPEG